MNITELLASFEKKHILVVGDLVVDVETYLERIKDDDTGKPTYRTILDERGKSDHYSIGGAGLVVRNLLELGAKVDWITAIGYGEGALFANSWSHPNLTMHAIQVGKPQTVKHRFKCNGEKVLQVDTMDNTVCTPHTRQTTITPVSVRLSQADTIVVADYRHGLIDEEYAKEIVWAAKQADKPLYVSSQVAQSDSNHHWYVGGDARFVLNQSELNSCKERPPRRIMTRGEYGCAFFDGTGSSPIVGTLTAIEVDASDTCGAGDAFLAAVSLFADRWHDHESIEFANTWAGLSTVVEGANPPTRQMLLDWCEERKAA